MKKLLIHLYFGALAAIALSTNVSAYLDPSTTTYLIQIIAGAFIALGATAGIIWHRLKRAVKKNNKTVDEAQHDESEEEKDEDEAD